VTFAAFCTLPKIGPRVIALWCRLLERVPGSRLLVAAPDLDSIRDEFLLRFAARGVAPERIELRGFRPFQDYLALHEAADVIVDTFPHAGGTTTCHALWMGVPVVSLAGGSTPARGGASILGTIGLDELVADTPEQYLNVACDLASDLGRLSDLRSSMRARMSASPLLDVARFTYNLEQAYRFMWRQWCQDRNRE
jgi:predicted O-linked N-acetylglucosamine transferase (SPINDLY family)